MSYKMAKVGELKQGSYAIINDEPSQIVSIQKSKPGKHGSAKFRCTAISLFDGRKQSFVSSTDTNIQIPIVDKRSGQYYTDATHLKFGRSVLDENIFQEMLQAISAIIGQLKLEIIDYYQDK